MDLQHSNGKRLVPEGQHDAVCVAVRAKKRRGCEEHYLSLEFDVDGRSISYMGGALSIDEVPQHFKSLKGSKVPIKVSHKGVNDVRHHVDRVDISKSVINPSFQPAPDKPTSRGEFNISLLDKRLRVDAGVDGVNECPPNSSFLATNLSPVEKLGRLHQDSHNNMLMFCSKYSRNGYRLHINKSDNNRFVLQVEVPYYKVEEINKISDELQEFKARTGNMMNKASLRIGKYAEEAFIYPINCLFEELGLQKRFELNTNIYYKTGDNKIDFTAGLFLFDVKNRHNVDNGRAFNRHLPGNRIGKNNLFLVHTVTEKSLTDNFLMTNDSCAMNIALMGGVTRALSEGKFRGAKYIEFKNQIDIMDLFKRIAIEAMREEGYC